MIVGCVWMVRTLFGFGWGFTKRDADNRNLRVQ